MSFKDSTGKGGPWGLPRSLTALRLCELIGIGVSLDRRPPSGEEGLVKES